ncbi:hypothetical protein BN159_0154 [Streptomyces davaonensis JCM 4913]|uniref:Uncharacterized protein n=1 Tax=Streptomyces davaonensis (strain DSM 101723 / JCM 4913 / KCC S-0913 / 768) TaxID=1214101 RepID=K4QUB3_STRDJ|nr:hypothetical protein BN159_0154 [Streptomyces davaonensis JCM 4913]
MGLTPARAANAASSRTRPGWDQATRTVAAVTGPIPVSSGRPAAGLASTSSPIRFHVVCDFGVKGEDPLGQTDGLGAGCRGGEVLLTGAPAGDFADLPGAEGTTGVYAEVGDAHEGSQGVHGPAPLAGEPVSGSEEDLCCRPHPLVHPRSAQLFFGERKHGSGYPLGVDRVGFADAAAASEHGVGMRLGVGVDADDERMRVGDNGVHAIRVPLREAVVPVAADRRRARERPLRGRTVTGHGPLGPGRLLIRPPRWAGSAPVARRSRTVHRQGTLGGHFCHESRLRRGDRRRPCQPVPDQPDEDSQSFVNLWGRVGGRRRCRRGASRTACRLGPAGPCGLVRGRGGPDGLRWGGGRRGGGRRMVTR